MRFRKTIKLGDIIRVNLSKTGASISAKIPGLKGLTFNTGSQGTYVTGSLPGTGLSERIKVSDTGVGVRWGDVVGRVTGKGTVEEQKAAEREEAARIKAEEKAAEQARVAEEKARALEELHQANMSQIEEINERISVFTNIGTYSADVPALGTDCASEKEAEAALAAWLCQVKGPVGYAVDYMASRDGSIIFADMDLPEIEDLPSEVASETSTGKLRVANMKQTDLREIYAKTVYGLSVWLASHFFVQCPATKLIVMSCYTQRTNSAGITEDTYVLSVKFDRDRFVGIDVSAMDPQVFSESFEHRVRQTTTGLFQKIEPFGPEEYGISDEYPDEPVEQIVAWAAEGDDELPEEPAAEPLEDEAPVPAIEPEPASAEAPAAMPASSAVFVGPDDEDYEDTEDDLSRYSLEAEVPDVADAVDEEPDDDLSRYSFDD